MTTNPKAEAARGKRGPTPAQRRNFRKRSEKAYAQIGGLIREKNAAYFMRRGRLTKQQRQVLAFIEGKWKPKRHTDEDEKQRRSLRIPTAVIMEAPRFDSPKVEGKRQNSIRAFLIGIIRPLAHSAA